ncbi:hypothetical protein QOZ80_6BG0472170 [Eleusine coracana subsp. coracana]|nr:hypothetical protein QOZ80_6BG0472170 [Eleusine coracana subsp. coracana]
MIITDTPLIAAWSASPNNDGVNHISSLPDDILRDIVSHLPAKDAVHTGKLGHRSVPLVFIDLLLECREDPTWRPGLVRTYDIHIVMVDLLDTHPGPFRSVQITCCYMELNSQTIQQWLQKVANKGVQEQLVFINRPWPLNIRLPAKIFSYGASLTSLHIGAWKFPTLPTLRMSPVLEVLTIISSQTDVRLCLVSHNLRCLQLGLSSLGDIVVTDAPRLERLLLWRTQRHRRSGGNKFSRIKIAKAPNLSMLGYWHPGQHQLQIGDTVIEADTNKVSPTSAIIHSIQTLTLDVNFDIGNEVKTLPAFIKCFPNIQTLHIRFAVTENR